MLCRLVIALLFASRSLAGQVTYTAQSAQLTLPFTTVILVPQFDRSLGLLESFTLDFHVVASGTVGSENLTNSPAIISPLAWLQGSSLGFTFNHDPGSWPWMPAAYDGTFDFAGLSGVTAPYTGSASRLDGYQSPIELDQFSGAGFVGIDFSAHIWFGGGPGIFHTSAMNGQATIVVTYTYSSYPAQFCAVGSYGLCPCQQGGGAGCPHASSGGGHGGELTPFGHSSLSSDDFIIYGSTMGPNTPVLFFQGTSSTFSGVSFGDGRRCVGGSIIRLGTKTAVGGIAQYPEAGDQHISVKGAIPGPGVYRAYQAWFRDPFGYCTPAAFNITSAVATVWTP
jgi:hypothetical protein